MIEAGVAVYKIWAMTAPLELRSQKTYIKLQQNLGLVSS